MDEEYSQRLEQLENRVALLERNQDLIAAGQRRSSLRSLWRRPPMWTFEQYPPRLLNVTAFPPAPAIDASAPRIAMVTPSYNHAQYLGAKYGTTDALAAAWNVAAPSGGYPNQIVEGSFEGEFQNYWTIAAYID